MRVDEAVSRIDAIHSMMNRTKMFRGYRSRTTLLSAVLAVVAAIIQAQFIPEPELQLKQYLLLWGSVAAISIGCAGWYLWKTYDSQSASIDKSIFRSAMIQLLPGIVAGAGLTFVICQFAAEAVWMLPGLWSICFGLAVCSSVAMLPKFTLAGGVYFIVAGLFVLSVNTERQVLAPWMMIVTFAFGQTINAVLLYWTLERASLLEEQTL